MNGTEWHCYHFIFILYSVFDVVMVFNQLFLVYETMMIQCTLIPCNGVDREINSILFYSMVSSFCESFFLTAQYSDPYSTIASSTMFL